MRQTGLQDRAVFIAFPTWMQRLSVLGIAGVLMAFSVVALPVSQEAGAGAGAETQQPGTPISNLTIRTPQVGQATNLTLEQEAALVEVRKILKEAQKVAEAIQVPSQFLTDRHRVKALAEIKARLIDEIEQAQFRAGDFRAAETTKHVDLLALAQAAYGRTQDAVQTTSRPRIINEDTLLVLVDRLIKVGDVPAALKAVDGTLAKGVTQADYAQRFRNQAAALALVARRQFERADPTAKATLQRALEAAQNVISSEDSYWAFLHVGRVQGMLGDRTGSVESFRKASRAAKGRGNELHPLPNKLLWLAKALAESGDRSASLKAFEEAIQLRHMLKDPRARVVTSSARPGHKLLLDLQRQHPSLSRKHSKKRKLSGLKIDGVLFLKSDDGN